MTYFVHSKMLTLRFIHNCDVSSSLQLEAIEDIRNVRASDTEALDTIFADYKRLGLYRCAKEIIKLFDLQYDGFVSRHGDYFDYDAKIEVRLQSKQFGNR